MASRTWLITGMNRGLGRALAEALLERGDRVGGTVRDPAGLEDLKARHGDRLWTATLDLADSGAIPDVVDRAFAKLGRIDVVVNNAGISLVGAAEECPEAMIRRLFDINLFGSIFVIKAALPHLRAQGGGRIYQISSSLGQFALPGLSSYVGSKWGIEGFIESTALDVAPFGIETTIFEPGAIRTDFGVRDALPPALAAYDGTPARGLRGLVEARQSEEGGSSTSPGDPTKMARVIVESADRSPAPRRVVMGSDSYTALAAAYRERAEALEAQRELACSTDF